MADENFNTDIDDWLSDLDEEETSGELDQADIDSLLGASDTEESPAEAEQPPPASEEAGPAEEADMDQDAIDSLIGDTDDNQGQETAAESETAELGQDDIDQFFGEAEGTDEAGDTGGDQPAADEEVSAADLDQSEIDELFASANEESGTEEMDIGNLFGEEDAELPAGADAFDSDAFTLEPTEDTTIATAAAPAGEEAAGPEPPPEPEPAAEKGSQRKPLLAAAAGVLLVLLIGGAGFWFYNRNTPKPEKAITTTVPEPQQVAPAPANAPPEALSNLYRMDKAGGAIDIELEGRDADGDQLSFEIISPPGHGRLSGAPPVLTYLPDKTFTGEDRFTFRTSDGRTASEPATIFISGPHLAATEQPARRKKKKPAPPPPMQAPDVSLATDSATPLLIDWRRIWSSANSLPFNGTVELTTGGQSLHGRLQPVCDTVHRYVPPSFFQGEEIIGYRFRQGKRESGAGLVRITIRRGNHPPEPRLAPLRDGYLAGQTVILDARRSMDDVREKLHFAWQQVAGIPVRLDSRNSEGSVVSFIMPSDFNGTDTVITLQLTVTDITGLQTSTDITVTGHSRRQAALWPGDFDTIP